MVHPRLMVRAVIYYYMRFVLLSLFVRFCNRNKPQKTPGRSYRTLNSKDFAPALTTFKKISALFNDSTYFAPSIGLRSLTFQRHYATFQLP